MSVICVSSLKKNIGKTTIISGIAQESINRRKKTFVGEISDGKIIHHESFYSISQIDINKVDLNKSEIVLVELNNLSLDDQKAILDKNDGQIIFVENSMKNMNKMSKIFGDRLIGFIINGVLRYKKSSILQSYRESSGNILAILDESRVLMSHTSKKVIEVLDVIKTINEKNLENVIENFLIGGFVLDWGPEYFSTKQNIALVVRGDRPDVQLSAIQSGTVNLIIATSGKTPVEYVTIEARKLGIPIAVVNEETVDVLEKVSDIIKDFDFDTKEKIQYSNKILKQNLNFDSLFEAFSSPVTK